MGIGPARTLGGPSCGADRPAVRPGRSAPDFVRHGPQSHGLGIACCVSFTLPDYLQLVDWTGRAVRDDKRGAIPLEVQPIIQRLGLDQKQWLEMIQHFGRRYRRTAGAVDKLQAFGQKLGRYWLQGIGTSQQFYRSNTPALP